MGGGYNGGGLGEQGYVVKISPSYSVDYLALLGNDPADAGDGRAHYHANAVAVNASGNAFVAGDGYDTYGNYTAYALEMTAGGSALVYDTEIVTTTLDADAGTATGISLDEKGNAWVVGYDSSGTMSLVNDFAIYPVGTATIQDGYLAEVAKKRTKKRCQDPFLRPGVYPDQRFQCEIARRERGQVRDGHVYFIYNLFLPAKLVTMPRTA